MDYRLHTRHVVFSAGVQGLYLLRNLLLMAIFARALGPAAFGQWSKLQALFSLLVPAACLGLYDGLERFAPSASAPERRGLLAGSLLLTLAGGVALTVLLFALAALFGAGEWTPIGLIVAAGPLAAGTALLIIGINYFRWVGDARGYGLAMLGHVVVIVAAALAAGKLLGKTAWAPVAAHLAGAAPGALVLAAVALGGGWSLRGLLAPSGGLRAALRFGLPLMPVSALLWVAHGADRYMLAWLRPDLGDAGVGVYSANYALGWVAVAVFAPFFPFLTPKLARLADGGDWAGAAHLVGQSQKFSALLAAPVLLLAVRFSGELLGLLAGEGYEARPAVAACVMAGYGFWHLGMFGEKLLGARLRPGLVLGGCLLAVTVNVAANLLLIPRHDLLGGLNGAALATTLCFFVYMIYLHVLAARIAGSGLRLLEAGTAALAAGLAFLPLFLLEIEGWLLLPACGGCVAAYAVLLHATGLVRRREVTAAGSALAEVFRSRTS